MNAILSEHAKRRIDDAKDAVAVVDKTMAVIYANRHWPAHLKKLVLPPKYLIDEYEAATLFQGIQEVIEEHQPMYTRKCRVQQMDDTGEHHALQITVTPCVFRDGSIGAELWCEHAQTGSTQFGQL